ncbi:MAG: hypothetical protein IKK74_09470 [Clostridia bacterium]|nr:hypothetical protein [Clostridia bacterium]MBQ3227415.1 hypothetical protein [Clostridia bacterium]MBR6579157.1 hypothetical protein [Clostridia bacterium]
MPQVKTKITRAVLLDDLYKNLKMGTTSTTDILGRVRDPDLRAEMTKTIDGFEGLASRVSKLMIEAGITPKEENMLTKAGAKIGMVMNTATDSTSEHLAEMMIQGLTMGVTELYRDIGEAEEVGISGEALSLAKDALAFEENAVEKFKTYL